MQSTCFRLHLSRPTTIMLAKSLKRVTYIHHKVMAVTTDVEALYEAEEALVRGHWADARRLNMIPGGRAGYRYLRRTGLGDPSSEDMPDDRDRAVSNWLDRNPDRPLPPT